jgi:putative protease
VWVDFFETPEGFALQLTDEDGHSATAQLAAQKELAKDATRNDSSLREHLSKFGNTVFEVLNLQVRLSQAWFVPASSLNALRRDAVALLEQTRLSAYERPARSQPIEPPVPYPDDTLTYLANVFNQKAHDFYAKHGVKVIEAAYESHEELGEASLMITKHCVRFSMSLCPKQAKGVTGVQGTVKAEPMQLINGKEKLTLRFDCKPCEMHVVGKMKKSVLNQRIKEMAESPITFYKTRP